MNILIKTVDFLVKTLTGNGRRVVPSGFFGYSSNSRCFISLQTRLGGITTIKEYPPQSNEYLFINRDITVRPVMSWISRHVSGIRRKIIRPRQTENTFVLQGWFDFSGDSSHVIHGYFG